MHDGEIAITSEMVRDLVADQFPHWAHLPVTPVASAGTDNALYRLGETMAVRLPRVHWAAPQPAQEYRWLPDLSVQLPLAVPLPLALGKPGGNIPYQWSVVRWLDGADAHTAPPNDLPAAARSLAEFGRALQSIDTAAVPPGAFPGGRGAPLAHRAASVQKSIDQLHTQPDPAIDLPLAVAIWQDALDAPPHAGAGVWLHGDMHASNLLVTNGVLAAVIDWGCMGVGDPACDLLPAWYFFDAPARSVYLDALSVDDAMLRRGRGWAVSMALNILPYYRYTNTALVRMAQRALAAVAEDV